MGDSVTRETTIQTRTVDDVAVDIVELAWKYGGVCYDVVRTADKELVNNESFDQIPTDDEIRDLLRLTWTVTYVITSGMDDGQTVVGNGVIDVHAPDEMFADQAATDWVEKNDVRYDNRIDPRLTILSVESKDD